MQRMIVIDLFYSSVMLMPVCVSVPFFFQITDVCNCAWKVSSH